MASSLQNFHQSAFAQQPAQADLCPQQCLVKYHLFLHEKSQPVMLRMLSAMPVGVTVPWVISPCRMVIMLSSLFKVLVRQDLQTSSLLITCKGKLIQQERSEWKMKATGNFSWLSLPKTWEHYLHSASYPCSFQPQEGISRRQSCSLHTEGCQEFVGVSVSLPSIYPRYSLPQADTLGTDGRCIRIGKGNKEHTEIFWRSFVRAKHVSCCCISWAPLWGHFSHKELYRTP